MPLFALSPINIAPGAFDNESADPDFTIHFPSGRSIRVHKHVLEAGSPVLGACATNKMLECQENQVVIEDDEDSFTLIVKALYHGYLSVPNDFSLVSLMLMANKYDLRELENHVLMYLQSHLSNENVMECFILDPLDERYFNLFIKVKKFLLKNKIFEGDDYLAVNFAAFSKMVYILIDKKTINSVKSAVVKWADERGGRGNKKDLRRIIKEMKFSITEREIKKREEEERRKLTGSGSDSDSDSEWIRRQPEKERRKNDRWFKGTANSDSESDDSD
jgi:hypothetical protein